MSGPIVVPENSGIERPDLQKLLKSWRNLLAAPELIERTVLFNQADFHDIRIPKLRRRWWFGKKEWIDWSDSPNWKRETEDYLVAIPVGGARKTGMETGFTGTLLTIALEELGRRPGDFPNLRHVPTVNGIGNDIWWGEDISELWLGHTSPTLETHRALGRAFGYREDRILQLYPDDWVDR
jgi:hypothetical protein